MTPIRQLTDSEMISIFIRAELGSPRFREKILSAATALGVTEGELCDTDYNNERANARRRAVLKRARPGIMNTLPADTSWQEVLLTAEEWSRAQYINDKPWVGFSDNTRLVSRGATKAMQQPHRTIHQRMLEIHTKLQRGEVIEDIILLSDPNIYKLVLVEGHVRATSFLALGLESAVKIPVILGISQHPELWVFY